MDNNTPDNEKATLEFQLVKALLAEQKSARRWKNTRFFIWVVFFAFSVLTLFTPIFFGSSHEESDHGKPYVALIHLNGTIKAGDPFSADSVLPELRRAFRDKNAKGVVLLVDSPGGSPVQASLIHDKIMQLKKEHHKTVIVVGGDVLASGAYLVATAADKIFVNPDTITGSIGVIMEGFGFNDAIAKIGVTRRVFTAGDNKDRLDPFEPLNPKDTTKIQDMLKIVHQDFINDVLASRKNKLHGDQKELFSGDFWTGTQAVQLGLADATATPWEAMQETFGTTHYRDYSPHEGFLESLMRNIEVEMRMSLPAHTAFSEKLRTV